VIRTTNINELPFGTPVFAKCKSCGVVLTHPPIQIPSLVKPGQPSRYDIQWNNYCLDCAPKIIKEMTPESITPTTCWSHSQVKTIDNPILKV